MVQYKHNGLYIIQKQYNCNVRTLLQLYFLYNYVPLALF